VYNDEVMKSVAALALVVMISLIPLSTSRVSALSLSGLNLQFGGYTSFSVPCTCSIGMIIVFTPFFTGFGTSPTGALYFQPPYSVPYAYFNIGVPTTWALGAYTPNPAAGAACLVGAPPACTPAPIPVFGIVKYMGTSQPGGIPPL
jgi:hypothetical protein